MCDFSSYSNMNDDDEEVIRAPNKGFDDENLDLLTWPQLGVQQLMV